MINAHYRLKTLTLFLMLVLLTGCVAGRAAYKRGTRAELMQDYERAMLEYREALDRAPGNIEYRLKYEQARFAAAFDQFNTGRRAFAAGDLETARTAFARTLEIDPTHALAEQELDNVLRILESRAQELPEPETRFEDLRESVRTDPSMAAQLTPTLVGPIDVRMTQDSRIAFETIAGLAGLTVIFDPDFRGATVEVDLSNVDIFEALDIISLQTRTFWKPLNRTTILISPDNQTKRREYEDHILKTIYLTNSISATEITEAITALRTLLSMRFIAQSTAMNAIIVRDTADRIAIAEKIIEDIDKSKPEVVVEAMLLEVDRNMLRDLGILPPQGTSLNFIPEGTEPGASGNLVPLRDLPQAINSANFSLNIPPAVARFLATNANTRLLQNPRIRATDGRLAQIRIGSRVPVPSGSFQPAFVGATGTPVVQFQYVDIGVNLDITPRVLLNREISMTVMVQVQALASDRDVGGIILPVFTNRQIQHEIRLAEGETNILGGIITDTEAVSVSGLPGLKEIPILRYLFSQERRSRDETEIIIVLTPHIVRMPAFSAANLQGLNIGTEVNTRLRAAAPVPQSAAIATPDTAAAPVTPEPTNAAISFSPSPVAFGPAGAASVSIGIEGSAVFGADLTLSFDPSSVAIREIRDGGFLSGDGQIVSVVQRVDTENGTVRVSLERPPGAGSVSGSGSLLTLLLEPGGRREDSVLRVTDFRVRDIAQVSRIGQPAEVRITAP